MNTRAVICFTRVPHPGSTKTRLMPLLSGDECAALHTAFLRDLAAVYRAAEADLFVAYTPDPAWSILQEIFPSASFFPQEGAGLGERMFEAIRRVLDMGYRSCLLTGSDLPAMTAAHLASGFSALDGADMVLGPTPDGGYYLVGMKQPNIAPFRSQTYGGSSVFRSTVLAAEAAGLTVAQALPCGDVDTPEDLLALCLPEESATAKYLSHWKERREHL